MADEIKRWWWNRKRPNLAKAGRRKSTKDRLLKNFTMSWFLFLYIAASVQLLLKNCTFFIRIENLWECEQKRFLASAKKRLISRRFRGKETRFFVTSTYNLVALLGGCSNPTEATKLFVWFLSKNAPRQLKSRLDFRLEAKFLPKSSPKCFGKLISKPQADESQLLSFRSYNRGKKYKDKFLSFIFACRLFFCF